MVLSVALSPPWIIQFVAGLAARCNGGVVSLQYAYAQKKIRSSQDTVRTSKDTVCYSKDTHVKRYSHVKRYDRQKIRSSQKIAIRTHCMNMYDVHTFRINGPFRLKIRGTHGTVHFLLNGLREIVRSTQPAATSSPSDLQQTICHDC